MNDKKVIALGMFDGVHIGHRALIRKAKEMAEAENASCLVYSFSNHPNQLLRKPYSLLTTNEEKKKLLKDAGADEIILDIFTENMMHIQPLEFLITLCKRWNVCGIVAGYNYSFGDKGKGNSQLLEQFCKDNRIQCAILPPVEKAGIPVSSTRIRTLLKEGNILSAASCLGYPYLITSKIYLNNKKNKFKADHIKIFPKNGKYAIRINIGDVQEFGYFDYSLDDEKNGVFSMKGLLLDISDEPITFSFVSEL